MHMECDRSRGRPIAVSTGSIVAGNVRKIGVCLWSAIGAANAWCRSFCALTRVVTAALVMVVAFTEISVIRAERW